MAASCQPDVKEPDKDNSGKLYQLQTKLDKCDGAESGSDGEFGVEQAECPVCLQTCIHPVQLPCTHIFCFLCVKGVANQSKRCALCRQEIPVDFLNNPSLVRQADLLKVTEFEDGYQWYYEGRNGWWQYDERTSAELEEKFKKSITAFEILIAGFLYVIDMDNMIQIRRNDPTRRRRIKRDLSTIPKKGVAGLKIVNTPSSQERDGADGGEGDSDGTFIVNSSTTRNQPQTSNPGTPPDGITLTHEVAPGSTSPQTPNNTPQSPEDGSPGEPVTPSEVELNSQMANLSISSSGHSRPASSRRRPRVARSVRTLREPRDREAASSSSDTDWD